MHRLRHKFHKTAAEYALIEEGDRILIAVSGGKDSLALLELMAARVRVLKPRFSVVAAHVVMTNIPYQSDTQYLIDFAQSLGVEMHIVETSFDATGDTRKSPCFLCSWNRRKALFETAKALGCNKIALGHHQDDVLVTLLMNMTFQGAFSTMPHQDFKLNSCLLPTKNVFLGSCQTPGSPLSISHGGDVGSSIKGELAASQW